MVIATKQKYRPIASFTPLGWQIAPWRCQKPVMLLTGSAGGGKSSLAANKIHAFMLKYPEAQGLITRKVNVSLTNSTILYMEKMVIGEDPRVRHFPSKDRFEYSNGSILSYAGLEDKKQRERLKSIGLKGGVDIAWMEEATEYERADFDAVQARIRGKAAHWRQTILTTNPDAPTHWIYLDLVQHENIDPDLAVFYSRASDNIHNPEDYQKTLARMQGIEGERLREGKWVQASGLVYDVWNEESNVSTEAEYMPNEPVMWFVDDGYSGEVEETSGQFRGNSHPRVFLLAQLRSDGTVCIFAEDYAVQKLSDRHIGEVLSKGYPRPQFAIVDKSAAELKGRLQSQGIETINGAPDVEESIKTMRNFIAPDVNGYRRLLVHPRCKHFRSEMASYRRDPVSGKPIKQFDHGCFVAGTIVTTINGDRPIEKIKAGEMVLTRRGFQTVLNAGLTAPFAELFKVNFSNGKELIGTVNHPIYVENRGFVPLVELKKGDIINTVTNSISKNISTKEQLKWHINKGLKLLNLKPLFSTVLSSDATQTRKIVQTAIISNPIAAIFWQGLKVCTGKFGKKRMGQYLPATMFTIKTATLLIILLRIWLVYLVRNTSKNMGKLKSQKKNYKFYGLALEGQPNLQRFGMAHPKGKHGIKNMQKKFGVAQESKLNTFVKIAVKVLVGLFSQFPNIVQMFVNLKQGVNQGQTSKNGFVRFAGLSSKQTNTNQPEPVPVSVVGVIELGQRKPVFNLTVADVPEYFANGVLVHNCDAARYGLYVIDKGGFQELSEDVQETIFNLPGY